MEKNWKKRIILFLGHSFTKRKKREKRLFWSSRMKRSQWKCLETAFRMFNLSNWRSSSVCRAPFKGPCLVQLYYGFKWWERHVISFYLMPLHWPWWWSASSPSTPTIWVRFPRWLLNLYKKTKINEKEAGVGPSLKKLTLSVPVIKSW